MAKTMLFYSIPLPNNHLYTLNMQTGNRQLIGNKISPCALSVTPLHNFHSLSILYHPSQIIKHTDQADISIHIAEGAV